MGPFSVADRPATSAVGGPSSSRRLRLRRQIETGVVRAGRSDRRLRTVRAVDRPRRPGPERPDARHCSLGTGCWATAATAGGTDRVPAKRADRSSRCRPTGSSSASRVAPATRRRSSLPAQQPDPGGLRRRPGDPDPRPPYTVRRASPRTTGHRLGVDPVGVARFVADVERQPAARRRTPTSATPRSPTSGRTAVWTHGAPANAGLALRVHGSRSTSTSTSGSAATGDGCAP